MKKISIMILLLVVALASCKKTPEVNTEYVDVERDLITVGMTTATVQCDYQYIATLKKSYFYYGEGENEADMNTAEMRVVQNTLYVDLAGLRANTTYNYYYEFHNGFNSMRTVAKTFKTEALPIALPTIITALVTEITTNSAKGGGVVTDDGGAEVTERGICWSIHENPTLNDSHVAAGTGTGVFTATMTGLEVGVTYHVRAYAVNEKGKAYGLDKEFTTNSTEGALSGNFSVSETEEVRFSKGNLQYRASTNTWRFAENQWDYVGENNANASATYEGWIDLYEWGTSGFDHGANHYLPWSSGGWNYDWAVYGDDRLDLCDRNGQADWGYNAISNGGNQERQWRTLTKEEWTYLVFSRQTTSGIRFVKANVNEINGIIILPDNWDPNLYVLNNPNDGSVSYDVNAISLNDWTDILEAFGAVFLPANGSMCDLDFGLAGRYWTASHGPTPWLKSLVDFNDGYFHTEGSYYPNCKYSVRLVCALANTTYTIKAVSNPPEGGTVEGVGDYSYYSSASLIAVPNEGYTFHGWIEKGREVSSDNPYEVLALFNRNLEARFMENTTYPLLYSYNDVNHTATIIGHWDGTNATGDLVVPETVVHNGETYIVTAIGRAFEGCAGLTSVMLPNSITFIDSYAFAGCSGLTGITIPSSVTSIGGINPFGNCYNLAQITVESGNTCYDSRGNCNAIISTSTNCLVSGSLGTVIPNSVASLGQDAFYGIPISSLTVFAFTPPFVGVYALAGVNRAIPVYIPNGTLSAYQNAEVWNEFTNFIEMP